MWIRVRFKSNADDIRPIYKPPALPEGPWWCSGYDSDDNAYIIAYVKNEKTIKKQWPEAFDEDMRDECEKINFTTRFPQPDWWDAEKDQAKTEEVGGDNG